MTYKFLEHPIDTKNLPKDYPIDICLVENNEKQVEALGEFLMGKKPLALVSGFRGSGKSELVSFVTRATSEDVLILHYTCFETSILDDLLLSFYDSFRAFTNKGLIETPRVKAENFSQKVNSYFNSISKPILVEIESFESVIKENKTDIVNFITHLTKFENVKVIVVSSKFKQEDFDGVEYDRVTTLAFTQKIFEKYLKVNGVKNIGVMSGELYKLTKGYYNYLKLSLIIMRLKNLNLVNFLESYSKSYTPFNEYIIREMLSFVDPVSAHLFRLLTIMRMPIHINLLKSLRMYDEERIIFFLQNSLLEFEGNCLYLKDIYRYEIETQIPENVMVKMHKACIELYNTQLPLKPSERMLAISRQTMRNEIDYHSIFLPKKIVLPEKPRTPVIQIEPVQVTAEETVAPVKIEPIETPTTQEEEVSKISFIIEDEGMLDNIAESITSFVSDNVQNSKLEQESLGMNLQQILNLAKIEEQNYNFKRVVVLYQNALTKTEDVNFYTFLPGIYIKLAKAYENISDLYEALEYYTQAYDFYYNASNMVKVYETKLEIANIYYAMYKQDNAKYVLTELSKVKDLPKELRIKVNLAFAKLTDNLKEEFEYYKNSLVLVDVHTEKEVLAELYYKYAAANVEKDDIRTAAQFYKKCIEVESNPKYNKYLSLAYANIAELYDEIGSVDSAIKYYNESIKIDTVMQNYNGLYSATAHLAEIYSSKDDKLAVEYYTKALSYAKQLNEPFYIVSASLEIGDFYLLRKNIEMAYKYFIMAYHTARTSLTHDNLDKVAMRLEDIKQKAGEKTIKYLQVKYGE